MECIKEWMNEKKQLKIFPLPLNLMHVFREEMPLFFFYNMLKISNYTATGSLKRKLSLLVASV